MACTTTYLLLDACLRPAPAYCTRQRWGVASWCFTPYYDTVRSAFWRGTLYKRRQLLLHPGTLKNYRAPPLPSIYISLLPRLGTRAPLLEKARSTHEPYMFVAEKLVRPWSLLAPAGTPLGCSSIAISKTTRKGLYRSTKAATRTREYGTPRAFTTPPPPA